jgi:hypothetical protein
MCSSEVDLDGWTFECKGPASGREDAELPMQTFGAGHSSGRPVVNVCFFPVV